MDREVVIIKTLRDLLLRVDSMDLRIGQFGENLKTINGLLSMTTSARRESNVSARHQRFFLSGTTVHDNTDFLNSIDRLNLDMSLRSNAANNTIIFHEDDQDAALDDSASLNNAELHNNLPKTYASAAALPVVSNTIGSRNTMATVETTSATNPIITTVISTPVAAAAAAAPIGAVVAAAAAATASTTSTTPTTTVTASTRTATTNTLPTTSSNAYNRPVNQTRAADPALNHVAQANCRLKVVSRNRQISNRILAEDQLKSFYVTPFNIEQTEQDIVEYLRETINLDRSTVKCIKLVPRNKDINELSFISFKLSVSEDLAPVISDRFYWPDGVEVREFQSKNEIRSNEIHPIR